MNGILVQLPLPPQINTARVVGSVAPEKDVDGFHPINFGRLAAKIPTLVPCTPIACIKLANSVRPSLDGLDALVVGRSNIVGNPLGQLLMAANATVTIAHTHTRNLPDLCRRAELLFVAIGHAEYIRGDWIKPGATVVDVGINRVPGPDGKSKIVGDVCFAEAVEGRRRDHAGAGRRRADDDRVPVGEYAARRLSSGAPAAAGSVNWVQLFQPNATLSSTRVPNFSDERATALPPSAR